MTKYSDASIVCSIAQDDGALYVRRRVLYKVDADRALELGLDRGAWWNQTIAPAKPVKDGITLSTEHNQTQIVKVLLADGGLGDRIVPSNGRKRDLLLDIPGRVNGEALQYHDSVYDYVEGKENDSAAWTGQDIIALSQSQDIDKRGKVSRHRMKLIVRIVSGSRKTGKMLQANTFFITGT